MIKILTKTFKIDTKDDSKQLNEVGELLRNGSLVAIPTETVYGLAANALDGKAVSEIFKAKGRPQDNPLIVHVSSLEEIEKLVEEMPEKAVKLAKAFWPGPLTIIMKKSAVIPDEVSCGLNTVGIRMPSHEIARAIIKNAKVPLAAPSANISGLPSPTNAKEVFEDMNGKIQAIVDSGNCGVGVESTVITVETDPPCVLRPGGVTAQEIEAVIGKIDIHPAVYQSLKADAEAHSPGMKYKHYSPKTNITIVKGDIDGFVEFLKDKSDIGVLCFEEDLPKLKNLPCVEYGSENCSSSQAQKLFGALRNVDTLNVKQVFARCPSTNGVGLAVYNRLIRAAAFEVISL